MCCSAIQMGRPPRRPGGTRKDDIGVARIVVPLDVLSYVCAGVLTILQADRVAANQPTPWLGIVERGNVYAIMLWVAVLAIGLLRAQKSE
jgi:hypothetical protein